MLLGRMVMRLAQAVSFGQIQPDQKLVYQMDWLADLQHLPGQREMLRLALRPIQRQVSVPSYQSDPEHFQSQALMLDQIQMHQKQAFRKLRQHPLLEPG
jgi:hypothetical protein